MPNYISKNAIISIPLNAQDVTNVVVGVLKSNLLNSDPYLVALASNNYGYKPLSLANKSTGNSVKLIKVALTAIAQAEVNFTLPFILEISSNFDQALHDNVIYFQTNVGISATGVVDSETLLRIDQMLTADRYFNNEQTRYLGAGSNVTLKFSDNFTEVAGVPSYEVTYRLSEKDDYVKQSFTIPLEGFVVDYNDNNVFIVPNPEFIQEVKKKNPDLNFEINVIDVPKTIKLNIEPIPLTLDDIEQIIEDTPPSVFDDPGEIVRVVQFGETASSIVLQTYYGQGDLAIPNEYTPGTNITVLPNRVPLSVQNRSEDARFQFYLNLLYYYNSVQEGTTLKEWGIKKAANHKRYVEDHLDSINVFDNKFDDSNPITAMPNYYRFLKRMEALDPQYKINFNASGETTSFETQVGKNIRIPSRKFADTMYNYYNYRHNETLTPVPYTNPDGTLGSIMDFVTDQVFNTVMDAVGNAIDTLTNIATEVKNDAIASYYEAKQIFTDIYNYVVDLMSYWPRGIGGDLEAGGSITWIIPIKTEVEKSRRIYRKVTRIDEFTLFYSTEAVLDVGADVFFGIDFSLGKKVAGGKKRKSIGLKGGGGVNAGIKGTVTTEYEFPIRKDETALLAMVANVLDKKAVNNLVKVLEYLDIVNLNPKQYLTKLDVSLENYGNLSAGVTVGLTDPKAVKVKLASAQNALDQQSEKSYASADNIFEKLPGIQAGIDVNLTVGLSFSYTVDYGSNPITTNRLGRVFETIDLELKSYIKGTADISLISGTIEKIFGESNPLISGRMDLLNFDKGAMLGVNYNIKRVSDPNAIVGADLEFPIINAVHAINSNDIKFDTENVKKSITIFMGLYSGDPDELCEPGSEVKLYLHAGKLYKLLFDNNYDFNLDNVKTLFDKIKFHKKIGYSHTTKQKKSLYVKKDKGVIDNTLGAYNKSESNSDELRYISKALSEVGKRNGRQTLLDFGIAVDVQMEISYNDIPLLTNCIKYYLIKLYYKTILIDSQYQDFKNKLDNNATKINTILRDHTPPQSGQDFITILGEDYYIQLFQEGNITYINNSDPSNPVTVTTPTKGMLGYIKSIYNFDLNADCTDVITEMIKGIPLFLGYLNADLFDKDKANVETDYGIKNLLDFFSFLSVLGNLEATLEAKAGITFEAFLKGGIGELTAGASISGGARVIYLAKFMDKGVLTINDLAANDPLRLLFENIKTSIAPQIEGKRNTIKTVYSS